MVRGLVDTGNITRPAESTDGYGNTKITESTVVVGWKYRKTIKRTTYLEELLVRQEGKVSAETIKFTGVYNALILLGDFIVEASGKKYEITAIETKRNANGAISHLFIFGENI